MGSLDLIDSENSQNVYDVPLPGGFALDGEIAKGGLWIALGSADNSGRIVLRHTDNLSNIELMAETPDGGDGKKHYMSVVKLTPGGQYLVGADFNTGKVWQWAVTEGGVTRIGTPIQLDTQPEDTVGDGGGFGISSGPSAGIWWQGGLLYGVGNDLKLVQ